MLADVDAARARRSPRSTALGVRVALDDFGTGYSSLADVAALAGRRAQDRHAASSPGSAPTGPAPRSCTPSSGSATRSTSPSSPKASRPRRRRSRSARSAASSVRDSISVGRRQIPALSGGRHEHDKLDVAFVRRRRHATSPCRCSAASSSAPATTTPPLPSGSQRLLALLALRDRSVTRLMIAGTLWPDSTEQHASASLRSALTRLRGEARAAVDVADLDLNLAPGVVVDIRESKRFAHRLLEPDAPHLDTRGDRRGRRLAVGRPAPRLVRGLGPDRDRRVASAPAARARSDGRQPRRRRPVGGGDRRPRRPRSAASRCARRRTRR